VGFFGSLDVGSNAAIFLLLATLMGSFFNIPITPERHVPMLDIGEADVRFGICRLFVRFTPESGHRSTRPTCPLYPLSPSLKHRRIHQDRTAINNEARSDNSVAHATKFGPIRRRCGVSRRRSPITSGTVRSVVDERYANEASCLLWVVVSSGRRNTLSRT
jgi:hypothetical protein